MGGVAIRKSARPSEGLTPNADVSVAALTGLVCFLGCDFDFVFFIWVFGQVRSLEIPLNPQRCGTGEFSSRSTSQPSLVKRYGKLAGSRGAPLALTRRPAARNAE